MSKGLLRSGITAAFDQDLWQALQITPGQAFEIDNCLRPALITGIKKTGQGTPGTPAVISAEKDADGNIVLLVKVTNRSALFPKLNEVANPDGDTTFTMSNKLLAFRYTAPTPAGPFDGAFEIEAIGGFTGNLVHVHQHTGNVGSTRLVDVEAEDADVLCLRVRQTVANAICAKIGDGLTIDKEGDLTTADILVNKRLKYTTKRDLTGQVQWKDLPNIGRMELTNTGSTSPTTAAGVNFVGANAMVLIAQLYATATATAYVYNSMRIGGASTNQTATLMWSGGSTSTILTKVLPAAVVSGTARAAGTYAWYNKASYNLTGASGSLNTLNAALTKIAQRDARTTLYLTGGA